MHAQTLGTMPTCAKVFCGAIATDKFFCGAIPTDTKFFLVFTTHVPGLFPYRENWAEVVLFPWLHCSGLRMWALSLFVRRRFVSLIVKYVALPQSAPALSPSVLWDDLTSPVTPWPSRWSRNVSNPFRVLVTILPGAMEWLLDPPEKEVLGSLTVFEALGERGLKVVLLAPLIVLGKVSSSLLVSSWEETWGGLWEGKEFLAHLQIWNRCEMQEYWRESIWKKKH